MRRSLIPVVVLAALTFFGGLGRGAIGDNDEAFYAESAREMVESGNWLTPHFNYEPRFQKPVLYYWLTAAVFAITGPSEVGARLWSALAGVGLVLITTACARRWYDESVGLLAGSIAATSFGYFAMARASLPDLPLAFCVTAAIWASFVATLERERNPRQWLLLAAAAMALGFLTKGPLAVLLPLLVVVPTLLLERRSLNVQLSDTVLAAAVFVAIAAPWYLVMWLQHGTGYLTGFFLGDNLERFATARFNDPRPWWFYLPVLAGGLLPWAPLTLVWVRPVWLFVTRRRDIGAIDFRLLLWTVLPLVFFTLSVGKQPRYILPLLPPLAILLASSIIERTSEWRSTDGARRRPRVNLAVGFGSALGGLSLVALAALMYRARPLFLHVSELGTTVIAACIAALGLMVVLVSARAWRSAPGALAFAAAITFALLPYGVLASTSDSSVAAMAEHVRREWRSGDQVGTYNVFVRNLVFYSGVQQTDIESDAHLRDWLHGREQVLLVTTREDMQRLQREGLALTAVASLPYFNEGVIKVRTLLSPDAASDLQEVVLVRVQPSPLARFSRD